MGLDTILSRIEAGQSVSSEDLLPYLCLERKEARADVNRSLAESFWRSGREDYRNLAKTFIQRAWVLSEFSPEILSLYTQIFSVLGDVAGIRDAYKRLGMKMAAQGNVSEAIKYFDLWQYAYLHFKSIDKYEFDFDILDSMDRLAAPYRFSTKQRGGSRKRDKIRVAYLVKGITETGAVLVRINLELARFHDRSRIEPFFFVPEPEPEVFASEAGREHLRLFESYGHRVRIPKGSTAKNILLDVARQIHDIDADILVTDAALASFSHYFITSLRPAPITVALVQGGPAQFAPPGMDWGISWSKHPLLDTPFDCSLTVLELVPERVDFPDYAKQNLDIPENAIVLATAGRHHKFQEPAHWQAILDLLEEHSSAYYLAIGPQESQVPFLTPMLRADLRARIRFVEWRGSDYSRALSLTDIFIDTFPSGGGVVVTDSMALGIPIVSFRNNYMRIYDQTDWSPAEELSNASELIVPRGDFDQMKRVVGRLIKDPAYRAEIGRRTRSHMDETQSNPERMTRNCEDIYFRAIAEKSSGNIRKERSADQEQFKQKPDRAHMAPQFVVNIARQLERPLRLAERMLDRIR